jgi:opacity protein-like surface antigen
MAIMACLLFSDLAGARSNIGFMGVGGKLGYVDPENIDGTFGLGFFVDIGTLVPDLSLEGNVDFWSKSVDICNKELDCDEKEECSDLSIGATMRYMIPAQGNVYPYAGGGPAVHVVQCSRESPFSNRKFDDSDTKIGIHALAGIELLFGSNFKAGGELRYSVVEDINNWGVFFRLGYILVQP